MWWLWLIIGLVVGLFVLFIAGCCVVAGTSDDASERHLRELQEKEDRHEG